jgi:hypothetical protein
MSNGSTHFLNGDALFSHECPETEYKSLKLYNKNIDYSTAKRQRVAHEVTRRLHPKMLQNVIGMLVNSPQVLDFLIYEDPTNTSVASVSTME